jgi:hypothetical protein
MKSQTTERSKLMDKFCFGKQFQTYLYGSYWYLKLYPKQKKKFNYIINEERILQSEHERYLVEKHFKCP